VINCLALSFYPVEINLNLPVDHLAQRLKSQHCVTDSLKRIRKINLFIAK